MIVRKNAFRLAAAVVSLFWGSHLKAEIPWGEISGEVADSSGKPLSHLVVKLESGSDCLVASTSLKGQFAFPFLLPAIYRISFDHPLASERGTSEIDLTFKFSSFLKVTLEAKNPGTWTVLEERAPLVPTGSPERNYSPDLLKGLPTTLHLTTLLGHTEISAVAERFDVAGMHSNESLLLGAHGSSWSQNETRLNGLSITGTEGDSMAYLPDVPALKTITYRVGNATIDASVPGAHLELIPAMGGQQIHGQGHLFFQGGVIVVEAALRASPLCRFVREARERG